MHWIKRGLLLLLTLFAAWLLVAWMGWLPRLDPGQRADLKLLRQQQPVPVGHNAYADGLLLGFEVPPAAREDVAKQVLFAQAENPRFNDQDLAELVNKRFPSRAALSIDAAGCGLVEGNCLAAVEADPAAVRDLLTTHANRLVQIEQMQEAELLWDPTLPALESPILGEWSQTRLNRTAAALDWVEGRRPQALLRLCRHAQFWRRARTGTNSLLFDMLGVGEIQASARLLATMLAQAPANLELPDSCTSLAQPLRAAELSSCAVQRREFQLLDRGIRKALAAESVQFDSVVGAWLMRYFGFLLFNREHTSALLATAYAPECRGEPVGPEMHAATASARAHDCGWLARIFNPLGCVIASVAMPDQGAHQRRRLDLDAQLRLLELGLRLRAAPENTTAQIELASTQPAWASGSHALGFDPVHRQLFIRLLPPRETQRWTVPLPWSEVIAAPEAQPDAD